MRTNTPAATLAFDRLAPEYDALANGEIFQLLRRRTHETFARRFRPGARVLEIGCGTGLDTAFLANAGVRVVACDPSEAMVGRSLRRLAGHGLSDRATVLPCGLQDAIAFLEAVDEARPFDGIVSNFGALNCVEDLRPLGRLASQLLTATGVVILNVMGRSCAFETVYFAATGRRRLTGRRRRAGAVQVPVAGVDVPTYFHRIRDIRDAVGVSVTLDRIQGIAVAVPPPYFETRWQTLPKSVRDFVCSIDGVVATWPPFNRLGDHVLLEFVKQRSRHD